MASLSADMKDDQPCSSHMSQSKKRQASEIDDESQTPAKISKLRVHSDGDEGHAGCPELSPRRARKDRAPAEAPAVREDGDAMEEAPGGPGGPSRPGADAGDAPAAKETRSARDLIDDIPPLSAKPSDAVQAGASLVNKDPRALHLKLLFRATVREHAEPSTARRRSYSDSYRPDVTFPPLVRNKVDSSAVLPRSSYSVDDLAKMFPNSKLDYFHPTKTYPRKSVRADGDRSLPKSRVSSSGEVNTDFVARGVNGRRCQCTECDPSSISLLPSLALYPTDRRGQADQTISRRYVFQARLVRPHPRSYRTARGGHMQWCRYEEDLIKLPLCLQFEVAFTAPDRHRIKLDIPRFAENAPTDISELGFYFDDADGILKERDTNTSGFYYVKDRLDKDKRRSRYILAVLGSYNYVSNLMIRESMRVVRKQILRLNGLYDVYSPTIYLSEEAGRRDKLVILVASKRVARPGVWSVRTLLHRDGGINIGSMLPYIRQAHAEGYSVLVANPNENHFVHPNLVDISHIPMHASPAEHLSELWAAEVVPASYARHVFLVLHETAYQAFFAPLIRERPRARETQADMEQRREVFFRQLQERVRGVALIGAVPQMGMNLALRPEMTRWMLENIVNFVPSTEPAETFLKTHAYGQIKDIRQLSSGTKDHDRIPETVRKVAFRFFASQHRKWLRSSEARPPPADAAQPSTSAQAS